MSSGVPFIVPEMRFLKLLFHPTPAVAINGDEAVARPVRGRWRSAELGKGGGCPNLCQGGSGWLEGEPHVLADTTVMIGGGGRR
jgi:hypothetical protein